MTTYRTLLDEREEQRADALRRHRNERRNRVLLWIDGVLFLLTAAMAGAFLVWAAMTISIAERFK